MKRVEIVANHSVETDILDALDAEALATYFTKIPTVHGRGDAEPKRGDHIWPEENFLLIIYTDDTMASRIEGIVAEIRKKHPDEGVRCFSIG